jgi:hypothetical protein
MKKCPWCGREVTLKNPRLVTCGHPRCTRQQARSKSAARPKPSRVRRAEIDRDAPDALGRKRIQDARRVEIDRDAPDALGRKRIQDAMRSALASGMREADAVYAVASGLKERPAAVLSVWRSS